MAEEREIARVTDPVRLSFSEQRQPLLRGERRHYLLARGDQLAFAAEGVRFGFAPDYFALYGGRIRGISGPGSGGGTFPGRAENLHNVRTATYLCRPGRALGAAAWR